MEKLPMIGLTIGVVVVVAIVALFVLSGVFIKKSFQPGDQNSGQSQSAKQQKATATILEARETGTTVGEHTTLDLLLEIEPDQGEPFQVRLTRAVYRLNADRYQPGASLQVGYASRSPDSVRLLSGPEGSPSGSGSPTDRLEELKALRDKGLITSEEFEKKKQEILDNL